MPRAARIDEDGHGTSNGPVTDSAARTAPPSRTKATAASISGARKRSGPGPGERSASITAPVAAAGASGARSSTPARRGQQLDRQHAREPVERAAQLARGRPAHRDVVLLHRRAGDRVDAGRDGEPLRARRRSPPACTGRSCSPSRRPGRRPGTAAGRGCAPRRGSGRCAARRCSRRRRRRSPGSRARTPSGAPWKLPLDSTRPSAVTTGLSIAEASSRAATTAAWASVSRAAPATCGAQRSE